MKQKSIGYIGLLLVCCLCYLVLGGQEGCPPCTDNDGDGYGNPASPNCPHSELDCDDLNPEVNPGGSEGPTGDPTCSDSMDNDCDGQVDTEDSECSSRWGDMIWGQGNWGGRE